MKKFLIVLFALALTVGMVSCGNEGNDKETETSVPETTVSETTTAPNTDVEETTTSGSDVAIDKNIVDMSCVEIMEVVYAGLEDKSPMVGQIEITPENSAYYVGVENLEAEEALSSEAMINAVAHSINVIRFAEGTDIEAMKTDIKEKVDPRKWICVGVDDDKVIVDSIGNVVILILDQENGEAYHENFLKLAK